MIFLRIASSCEKIFNLLLEMVKCRLLNILFDNLLMFDLFDRANYLEIKEGKVDLVSFSSTLASKELLALKDYSTAHSSSILT